MLAEGAEKIAEKTFKNCRQIILQMLSWGYDKVMVELIHPANILLPLKHGITKSFKSLISVRPRQLKIQTKASETPELFFWRVEQLSIIIVAVYRN